VDNIKKHPLPEIEYRPDASGPLDDLRVLDLSRLVAGNTLTHFLADFGAEIIKIERPGYGDDLRNWRVDGISVYWKVYARNKKSVTLNFRQDKGRELLLELAETAQILVENFIPGTLEKWNLGPEILHEVNPDLIVVRISGWGQTGPDKRFPGFGSLVEARTGFAALNGFADRAPVLPPLALADMVAGLYGGVATLVALRHREVSGGAGQVIDLPLFDPLLSILGPQAAQYELTGEIPTRMGSRLQATAPRNVYCCRDGRYVALSASMQSMFERLMETIGQPDFVTDPRFLTNADRVKHSDTLDSAIGKFIGSRSQAENLAIFQDSGVTVGPVHDIVGLLEDPLVKGREVIVRLPDDEMESLAMHNIPARLSVTPGLIRAPAPALGEHNVEVLTQLGYGNVDLTEFAEEGTI
jgi:crotonobetainyl-CoA:carnitine CoA-transferase CaiB-like acyl-CoA transferase